MDDCQSSLFSASSHPADADWSSHLTSHISHAGETQLADTYTLNPNPFRTQRTNTPEQQQHQQLNRAHRTTHHIHTAPHLFTCTLIVALTLAANSFCLFWYSYLHLHATWLLSNCACLPKSSVALDPFFLYCNKYCSMCSRCRSSFASHPTQLAQPAHLPKVHQIFHPQSMACPFLLRVVQ